MMPLPLPMKTLLLQDKLLLELQRVCHMWLRPVLALNVNRMWAQRHSLMSSLVKHKWNFAQEWYTEEFLAWRERHSLSDCFKNLNTVRSDRSAHKVTVLSFKIPGSTSETAVLQIFSFKRQCKKKTSLTISALPLIVPFSLCIFHSSDTGYSWDIVMLT